MNNYVVAIDPSLHSTGIAFFCDRKLIMTKSIEVSGAFTGYEALNLMQSKVMEYISSLQVYGFCYLIIEEQVRHKNDRMRMEDFVKLSALSYIIGCIAKYQPVVFVKPSQWKKQIPKKVHHNRIMEYEAELGTDIKLLQDNQPDIMDAIGIGRWYYANHK